LRFVPAFAIGIAGIALALGCGSKPPRGVAEVPECRSAAASVPKSDFDTGIDHLKRQADTYSECMTAHGYVLDQEQLDEQLLHIQQVQNADVMAGDPFFIIAKRRQQLRMSPALWRPAAPSDS
jgi:hypothetical protein